MSILNRFEQHFNDIREGAEKLKMEVDSSLLVLKDECKSKVEADIAKVKNTLHKISAYIESKL